MGNIEFAWDSRKARANIVKHGISFDEARTVFLDNRARIIDDPDHSDEEKRFVMLGYSFPSGAFPPVSRAQWKRKPIGATDEIRI